MGNFCFTNKTICEDATSNGYCSLTACRNIRLCRNTIMSEGIYPVEEIKANWSKKPSDWHTGTPTEEGYYLIAFHPWGRKENGICYSCLEWKDNHWFDPVYVCDTEPYLIAWQKIEPYKERIE